MSDPFIDALHDRLKSGAGGAGGSDNAGHDADALARWWQEFVDVLGQKVGAWNERQAPKPPLNFTKEANGRVHVWHRSAEATFIRDGDAVRVLSRLGADQERETSFTMRVAADGNVVLLSADEELRSPAAAAEHALTPVLVATFAA
jgi:uncharacterized protein YfaA (DUF2138 family)